MSTPCALKWREAGERERVWAVNRGHPIAQGLEETFVLENEEMYGEQFSVPEPLETVFISWFAGGEVFRSGMTWRRARAMCSIFRPGHETYPTYHDANVRTVLRNAVKWAYNPQTGLDGAFTPRRTFPSKRRWSRSWSAGQNCTRPVKPVIAEVHHASSYSWNGRHGGKPCGSPSRPSSGVEAWRPATFRRQRVDAFSENHDIHNRFTRLEDALAWNRFDAAVPMCDAGCGSTHPHHARAG